MREGLPRLLLLALLAVNTALQTAGGAMMLAQPRKLAMETFGVTIAAEAVPLVAVLGGATVSYALLSGTAAVGGSAALGITRRRLHRREGGVLTRAREQVRSGAGFPEPGNPLATRHGHQADAKRARPSR